MNHYEHIKKEIDVATQKLTILESIRGNLPDEIALSAQPFLPATGQPWIIFRVPSMELARTIRDAFPVAVNPFLFSDTWNGGYGYEKPPEGVEYSESPSGYVMTCSAYNQGVWTIKWRSKWLDIRVEIPKEAFDMYPFNHRECQGMFRHIRYANGHWADLCKAGSDPGIFEALLFEEEIPISVLRLKHRW